MGKEKNGGSKLVAANKKEYQDYFVLEKYECGIQLFGTEVKSVRKGTVNLKDSYCYIKDGEIFATGIHISPYEKGNIFNRDPDRPKKLLMHRKEILKLFGRIGQEGLALVPLTLYFKDSLVKLEIGVCKGKKLYDKRDDDAKKQASRDIKRIEKTDRRSGD